MNRSPIIVDVRHLSHTYGTGPGKVQAVLDVSFALESGKSLAIVGPSGAGKTTVLRCLTGLLRPQEGELFVAGERVTGVPEGIGVVFQDYSRSLYPWLSSVRNVGFPLRAKGTSRSEMRRRAMNALDMVGLADMGAKYPWQLSGGMQQRVAIARALVTEPSLLVMDEPFASVDAQTRAELEDLTLRIKQDTRMSMITVTHDIDESVYLSDRVVVLSKRPSVVLAELPVELPYPRDQISSKAHPSFLAVRQLVHQHISAEKMKEVS